MDVEETIVGEMAHGWAEIYEDGIIEDMTTYPRTAYYGILWTTSYRALWRSKGISESYGLSDGSRGEHLGDDQ